MAMSNPVEAANALDNLPIGARVVACGIDDDKTAFGVLFEHTESEVVGRFWEDRTQILFTRVSSRQIVHFYDDMVIAYLPELAAPDAEAEYQAVCGSWDCRAPECKPKGI